MLRKVNTRVVTLVLAVAFTLVGTLAIVVLAEIVLPLLFHGDHPHDFGFEGFPAFGSLYGLLSCVLIILVSKLIGKAWLMRREDFYDD